MRPPSQHQTADRRPDKLRTPSARRRAAHRPSARTNRAARAAALLAVFTAIITIFNSSASYAWPGGPRADAYAAPAAERDFAAAFFEPALLQLAPASESVQTYAADCATPKTDFTLGDTMCVKGSVPLAILVGRRSINIIGPANVVRASAVVSGLEETLSFTIPTTAQTVLGSESFDNRGTWRADLSTLSSSRRASSDFNVASADAGEAAADLQIVSFVDGSTVPSGGSLSVTVYVLNVGPNPAANVVVTPPAGSGLALQSFAPVSGSDCGATCSVASLVSRGVAKFTATYDVTGTPGSNIVARSSVTSDTPDPRPTFDYRVDLNNPAPPANTNVDSIVVAIGAPDSGSSCTLTCRENIVVTADASEGGQPGAFVSFGAGSGAGDCGAINATPSSDSFFPVGETTVNVASETGGGSCSFTVTVIDTPAPTISCPADITHNVSQNETSAAISNLGTPTTNPAENVTVVGVRSDNLPQTEEEIENGVPRRPVPLTDPYPLGMTLVTWTVTDAAGRTASCSQRITVRASTRPVLTISCPSDLNVPAPSGACEATVTPGAPTTNLTDSHVSVQGVRSDGEPLNAPYPAGQTRITWTATDDADDSVASCVQTINVTGSTDAPPTLKVPADVTVETASCTAIVDDELGVATAESGCGGGSVSVSRTGVPRRFIFRAGTTVITYTATDTAGRQTTGTQRVTVRESNPPTITAPPDVQAFANASCQATGVGLGAPTFSDNCSGSTVTNDAPASFPVGQTVVTWTVTDASGNAATDTQLVTVIDNTAPSVETPEMLSASADGSCQVAIPAVAASASDNCTAAGSLTVTQSPAAGTMVGLGTHTITVTVKDAAGNDSSDTTAFTVTDTTAPTLNVPADIVVSNDAGSCSAAVSFAVTASDNCGTANVQLSHQPGSVFQKGTTEVTATAIDAAGNTTIKKFNVTVNDTENPTIAVAFPAPGIASPDGSSVTVYLPLNSPATSMPVSYTVTAADNCPGMTLNVSPVSGSVFPVGPTTVTATATDAAGNVTTRTFTVKVLYNFTGFFSPVDNLPVLNQVKAGQNIPLKFSLSGNKGLAIFAAGFPASQQVSCSTNAPINNLQETDTPGGSTLAYDASSDRYQYNWKTEKSWAGTCRLLTVKLNDGSTHTANFKFK